MKNLLHIIKNIFHILIISIFLYFSFAFITSTIFIDNDSLFRLLIRNNKKVGGFGYSLQRFREVETLSEKKSEVDFVILGSSHAYRGFHPEIFKDFNYSSINLGSSSQSPINSYFLAKEYLPRLNSKYLIYEGYYKTFQINGIESFLDLSINLPAKSKDILWEMAHTINTPETYNAYFAARFERITKPIKQRHQQKTSSTYYSGGYNEMIKIATSEDLKCSQPSRQSHDQIQLDFFEKTLKIAKQQGYKVIVVAHPLPQSHIKCVINYTELSEKLKHITEKNFAYYIDYNLIIEFPDKYFADQNHLNKDGVEKFNKIFLNDFNDKIKNNF